MSGYNAEYINKLVFGKYDIHVEKSVGSTNNVLKKLASQGEKSGYVLIAEHQTAGRGRLGKSFYSPFESGLYMSVLLRPIISAEQSVFITPLTAVAVMFAVEKCFDVKTSVKWVNDIYVDDKKVCGILTESSFDINTGKLDYVVIGIGINISEPDGGFPDDIKNIAASLCSKADFDKKNRLVVEILNELDKQFAIIGKDNMLDEYRLRSYLDGKKIRLNYADKSVECTAVGIDENAKLTVCYDDGITEKISSGIVSIEIIKQ